MLEGDVALDRGQRGAARAVDRLGRRVEDVAQPLDRQPRLVEVLPDLGQPQHRRADAAGQHVEGDQLAHRELALDHQLGAEIEDARHHHLVDELDGLARDVAER